MASIKGSARHSENRYSYDLAAQTTTREAHTSIGGQLSWAPYVDTYRSNVLVRQSFPTGVVMRYSYDARLNLIAIQDPTGFVQERVFSPAGDLIAERTPMNSTQSAIVQFTYDGNHRMVTQTDANGNQTKYGYSGSNVGSITPPGSSNGATTFKYDRGLLTEIETPIGRQTFTYDAVGNPVRANEFGPSGPALNGNGSRTTYNEAGQATSFIDPRGVPTTGAVDPKFTTTWTYDNAGNLISTRNPVGVVTTFTFDDAADVVSSSNPSGVTTYTWSESALTRTTSAPRWCRHHADLRPVRQRPRRDLAHRRHHDRHATTRSAGRWRRPIPRADVRYVPTTRSATSSCVDDGAGTVLPAAVRQPEPA